MDKHFGGKISFISCSENWKPNFPYTILLFRKYEHQKVSHTFFLLKKLQLYLPITK